MTQPIQVTTVSEGVARLTWSSEHSIHDVRRGVDRALAEHPRVEALINPDQPSLQRMATFAGLMKEGVARGLTVEGRRVDRIVYARLDSDTPVEEPQGFRSLLNSFLPRKRAIGQMVVRDPAGRVLLCRLTYKQDWDLPGGVVEVGESPREAVTREVSEELGLEIPAGDLMLTDWLPPWSGWDDALCLVFDGGTHDPDVLGKVVRQEREIKDVAWCTMSEVDKRAADFTARRIHTALDPESELYSESGRSPGSE